MYSDGYIISPVECVLRDVWDVFAAHMRSIPHYRDLKCVLQVFHELIENSVHRFARIRGLNNENFFVSL